MEKWKDIFVLVQHGFLWRKNLLFQGRIWLVFIRDGHASSRPCDDAAPGVIRRFTIDSPPKDNLGRCASRFSQRVTLLVSALCLFLPRKYLRRKSFFICALFRIGYYCFLRPSAKVVPKIYFKCLSTLKKPPSRPTNSESWGLPPVLCPLGAGNSKANCNQQNCFFVSFYPFSVFCALCVFLRGW